MNKTEKKIRNKQICDEIEIILKEIEDTKKLFKYGKPNVDYHYLTFDKFIEMINN